jgi:hypothetical protein
VVRFYGLYDPCSRLGDLTMRIEQALLANFSAAKPRETGDEPER